LGIIQEMNDASIPEPPSPTVSQQTKRHRSRCLYLNEVNKEGEGRGNVLRDGKDSLAWDDFTVHSMTRRSQVIYTSKISVINSNMLGVLRNYSP